MKRWLPFIAGFIVCACVTWAVACQGGLTGTVGEITSDPSPAVAAARADADRVVREATERAAAAEAARLAAEARAADASLTAEERAAAAAAAQAALSERDRAQRHADDMKAINDAIEALGGEVATIRNIPIPKGISLPELFAWLLGTGAAGGGFLTWLTRALGPNRKKLEELLAKAKAKTEEWDRETRMTMEDAAELAPLLAQLKAGAPPAPGA